MGMEMQRAGAVIQAAAMYAEAMGYPDMPIKGLRDVVKDLRDGCDALLGITTP